MNSWLLSNNWTLAWFNGSEGFMAHSVSDSRLVTTGLNDVLLPTLFNVVNNIVQHC